MTIKEFFSFKANKFFWINIIAMIVVVIGVIYGVLKGIDIYTRHGEAVVVPDVKGLSLAEAQKIFSDRKLNCVVSDSNYVKSLPAGSILEYNPAAGLHVKEGRTIYLTINTLSVPLQEVPDVADNSSARQAEARLLAAGFKLTANDSIPGEKDWVYEVRYKGMPLGMKAKVPMGAVLTLVIGNGKEGGRFNDLEVADSLDTEETIPAESAAIDDNDWF